MIFPDWRWLAASNQRDRNPCFESRFGWLCGSEAHPVAVRPVLLTYC